MEAGLRYVLCLPVVVMLAGCVAPEAPQAAKANPANAYRPPPPSAATFEDAPRPNRKIGGTDDSIVRMAK